MLHPDNHDADEIKSNCFFLYLSIYFCCSLVLPLLFKGCGRISDADEVVRMVQP